MESSKTFHHALQTKAFFIKSNFKLNGCKLTMMSVTLVTGDPQQSYTSMSQNVLLMFPYPQDCYHLLPISVCYPIYTPYTNATVRIYVYFNYDAHILKG